MQRLLIVLVALVVGCSKDSPTGFQNEVNRLRLGLDEVGIKLESIEVGKSVTREFLTEFSAHYFSIIVSRRGRLTAWTTGNMDTSGLLYSYTEDFDEPETVVEDDDSGEDYNFRLSAEVERGIYIIMVFGFEAGAYTLTTAFDRN